MDNIRDRKARVELKSIIGAEYILNGHPLCLKHGIAGKTATLMKQIDNSDEFWVKVADDVYKLPRTSWDLNIVSGLLEVNYLDLMNFFKERTLSVGMADYPIASLYEIYSPFMSMDKSLKDSKGTRAALRLEVGEWGSKDRESNTPNVVLTCLDIPFIFLGSKGHTYMDGTYNDISRDFYRATGMSLWEIMKAVTLMELPICSCGCRHQLTRSTSGVNEIRCAECESVLYHQRVRKYDVRLPDELSKVFIKAQTKISKYYKLRRLTTVG